MCFALLLSYKGRFRARSILSEPQILAEGLALLPWKGRKQKVREERHFVGSHASRYSSLSLSPLFSLSTEQLFPSALNQA